MFKYFKPLGVFIGGQFLCLAAFLLLPGVDSAAQNLATETAAIAPTFWGWSWAPGLTKLLLILALEAGVLIATGRAFLSIKD